VIQSGDEIIWRARALRPPATIRSSIVSISPPAKPSGFFQSDNSAYETIAAVLDDSGTRLLTRRESPPIRPITTSALILK